jgi:hypothetical protein
MSDGDLLEDITDNDEIEMDNKVSSSSRGASASFKV